MKRIPVLRVSLYRFAAALIISAMALGTISWVSAYAGDEPPTETTPERNPVARLERLFAREQDWLARQAERLERSDEVKAKAEEKLAALKEAGKDTSALEAALERFEELVEEAQSAHDEAARILKAGKGFDSDGKVTDREEARETVMTAGKALREAHANFRQAVAKVRHALRQLRRERSEES